MQTHDLKALLDALRIPEPMHRVRQGVLIPEPRVETDHTKVLAEIARFEGKPGWICFANKLWHSELKPGDTPPTDQGKVLCAEFHDPGDGPATTKSFHIRQNAEGWKLTTIIFKENTDNSAWIFSRQYVRHDWRAMAKASVGLKGLRPDFPVRYEVCWRFDQTTQSLQPHASRFVGF